MYIFITDRTLHVEKSSNNYILLGCGLHIIGQLKKCLNPEMWIYMHVDDRIGKTILLCIIWTIVISITSYFVFFEADFDTGIIFIFAILLIASGVLQAIGITAYLGHYESLSGFNTATDEQLHKYRDEHDLKKVSSFIGWSFSAISYLTLFSWLILRELTGVIFSIVITVMLILTSLIAVALYVNLSKRFGI